MTNFGYCCINLELTDQKITSNRGMIKRTFLSKGLDYVSELVVKNTTDLIRIAEWNRDNDIHVFRISSDMFPWMSEYEISELPDIDIISSNLSKFGQISMNNNIRLSFHPGPFNVLGSPNPDLIQKTTKEINQHAEILDMMGTPATHFYPINIHCNGTYGNKTETLQRWCENKKALSESARNRLVIENDDKASMYSVKDLYEGVYQTNGTPITFDYHHHRFNDSGLTEQEAFELAYSTWDVKPLFHYSSCRKTFEDASSKAQAHADMVYENINTYAHDVDIELEAKAKEKALIHFRKNNGKLLEVYKPF